MRAGIPESSIANSQKDDMMNRMLFMTLEGNLQKNKFTNAAAQAKNKN